MGMMSWLWRLLGFGSGNGDAGHGPAEPVLTPEELREARRRVIAYLRMARNPIRLTTEARRDWFVDLGKLYETIRTAPTQQVLEKAGEIGIKFQPRFREPLAFIQGMEAPPECQEIHEALIGWISTLESACVALERGRMLKDRAQLGVFRERLNEARGLGKQASTERAALISNYKLLPTAPNRKVGTGVALRARARSRLAAAAAAQAAEVAEHV